MVVSVPVAQTRPPLVIGGVCSGGPSIATLLRRYQSPARSRRCAHPDMVILASCREPVRLRGKVLVLRRARLLERDRLEVACGYGLAVVPADLECSYTHVAVVRKRACRKRERRMSARGLSPSSRWRQRSSLRGTQPFDRLLLRLLLIPINRPLATVSSGNNPRLSTSYPQVSLTKEQRIRSTHPPWLWIPLTQETHNQATLTIASWNG